MTHYYTNEKSVNDALTRAPRGHYHMVVTYLSREQIEKVLDHYRGYIDSALYILHDKDKKHTEEDFGVLLKKLEKARATVAQYEEKLASSKDDELKAKFEKSLKNALSTLTKLQNEYDTVNAEKDELKIAHWHVLLKCFDSHTESAVRKYFYRFRFTETKEVDGNQVDVLINSTNELVDCVGEARDYLTHENEYDKYHYSKQEVLTFGRGWEAFNQASRSADSALEIVDRLASGVSLRRMCKEYGRDLVYHYRAYREFAHDMLCQEMRAQEYVDVCNAVFQHDTIEFTSDDGRTCKLDTARYNKAVEIVTEFEQSFELYYQGE